MSSKFLDICVIPAAGKGTRWAPLTGYLPKEMLPLIERPVIEWVVKEVVSSGCNNIIIVTNKQKKAIETYIRSCELSARINVTFINQDQPLGIAHAISLTKNYIGNKPFVVALPDLPTISRKPVTRQLISIFEKEKGDSHIVSFDKFSSESAYLYGECLTRQKGNGLIEILHFCPKQVNSRKPHHQGNNVRMSGRFIFTSDIFPIINTLLKKKKNEEISDRAALREAQNLGQKVIGVKIVGHTYDTGYPEGYVRANTAFFKRYARKKGVVV